MVAKIDQNGRTMNRCRVKLSLTSTQMNEVGNMGFLIDGRWVDDDDWSSGSGEFTRSGSTADNTLSHDIGSEIAGGTGRFVLVASLSCPWSHSVLIARTLKGLEENLPLQIAGGPRVQGYALDRSGPLAHSEIGKRQHIHELYVESDPSYSGRATVPIIWDRQDKQIVSNDSAKIMRGLDDVPKAGAVVLAPEFLRHEIDKLNALIYTRLSNGVYRAGLARSQAAYNEAVACVFDTLENLDKRLETRRYLFGSAVTETDWRLFTTLVRFDAVYATHFRCTRYRLTDFPNLWAYARDLYQWEGIADTIDFSEILAGYYLNDGDRNPHRIIAERPDADWLAPPVRDHLGSRTVFARHETLDVMERSLPEKAD
ncbi:glutathione S-transferase C-terminal domain-containing protein [Rhizobiales bacterium]|uniref:glutathione S-transferase C-terminal domain-containing protein n=1 Tax=Hongsoonwoonella zoysiae TaxID=2821844 RepID=UPI00155FB77A|nr:glutathione S-transferase C-terminal domain-containing protein [Hongsoonwoonella zoysiae]NRG19684.1 glutathione S-transferase C-terminal domain-containing protein [Hongsoonwoonella zoysiae]